jgi:hypothetical protein
VDRFFHFADAAPGFTPKTGAFVLFDPQDHQKGPRAVNVRLDPASLFEIDRTNGKISVSHFKRERGAIGSSFLRVILCSVVMLYMGATARENHYDRVFGIVVILWVVFVADFLIKGVRAFCRSMLNLARRLFGTTKSTQPTKPAKQWTYADASEITNPKASFVGVDEDDRIRNPQYRHLPGNIYNHVELTLNPAYSHLVCNINYDLDNSRE